MRLEMAKNAFNFMFEARQDAAKYGVIQNSFTTLYEWRRLYKRPAILQPRPMWKV